MGLTLKELLEKRSSILKELIKPLKPDAQDCIRDIYDRTQTELIQNVACGRALERYIKEVLNHDVNLKKLFQMIDEEVKVVMPEEDKKE